MLCVCVCVITLGYMEVLKLNYKLITKRPMASVGTGSAIEFNKHF
jgi:hypothetical protein